MDNFKTINDSYGHELGDQVLRAIARRLGSLVSGRDLLVRYSGDEFIAVVYDRTPAQLEELTSRTTSLLHQPYVVGDYSFVLSASIGVAAYPRDGQDLDEVKRYADLPMYEAKKNRNSTTFFEKQLKEAFLSNALIEQQLRQARQREELYMMYQPQIDLDGRLHGVEALVRWHNSELGHVGPDKFIPIAEATGEMPAIGAFVIDRALAEINAIHLECDELFELSINISVKQFLELDFYAQLLAMLEKHRFNIQRLVLEVTENVFIDDVVGVMALMNKLKQLGIQISLDDFGTGYSSLSLLKRLPIDELKIDKSFVDDMLHSDSASAMVESIIAIAEKLGLSTVAEGVETAEQRAALSNMGCTLFQGYYHSKPLRAEQLVQFIKAQQRC